MLYTGVCGMRKYSGASEVIDSIIVGAICTTCMRAGEDDEVVKTRGVVLLGNWKRAEPTGALYIYMAVAAVAAASPPIGVSLLITAALLAWPRV